MTSLPRRSLALILALTYSVEISGCTRWTVPEGPPGVVAETYPEQRIRVTRPDSSRVELVRVTVANDSLFGYVPAQAPGAPTRDPYIHLDPLTGDVPRPAPVDTLGVLVAMPLEEVAGIEVKQGNTGGTVGLIILGVGVTGLIVAAAAAASNFNPMGGAGSSCPLVYSWDGSEWHLDSGTFAGAIMPALQHTDLDELVRAVPVRDTLHLRVTGRSGETEFLDELTLLAADHPAGTMVAPDGRANGLLHTLGQVEPALSARDDAGRDMTAALARLDGRQWESLLEYRTPDDVRDGVELTFHRPPGEGSLKLVIDGQNTPWAGYLVRRLVQATGRDVLAWYDPGRTEAAAREFRSVLATEASLAVSIWRDGAWQPAGRLWEVGPELGKRQVLPIDLAGVTDPTVRVRLESAPSFWLLDRVGADYSDDMPVTLTPLPISRMDMAGSFDPAGLVRATDHEYLSIEPTQVAELSVPVPPLRAGLARTFLVRSSGWYRVHGEETAAPERELLTQLHQAGPYAASRTAVGLMNEALAAMVR
jgi:hypothetical protein